MVDSSPDAVAAMVTRLRSGAVFERVDGKAAAALLSRVATERDERDRQLAEARAALSELESQASKIGEIFGLEEDGHIVGTQTRPRYSAALRKARALLAGETP